MRFSASGMRRQVTATTAKGRCPFSATNGEPSVRRESAPPVTTFTAIATRGWSVVAEIIFEKTGRFGAWASSYARKSVVLDVEPAHQKG